MSSAAQAPSVPKATQPAIHSTPRENRPSTSCLRRADAPATVVDALTTKAQDGTGTHANISAKVQSAPSRRGSIGIGFGVRTGGFQVIETDAIDPLKRRRRKT